MVGAQSEAAPAMHRAWADDTLDPHDRMETFAEGVATRVPFALTTALLRDRLDDFRLVSEAAIRRGVRDSFREERVVLEGASATSLAAMRQFGDDLAGSTVVVPVSGRNIDPDRFAAILDGTE